MDESEQLKMEILAKVKIYYDKKFKNKDIFVPGETRVNYGGRLFDENELVNLVDSSLEFWLTEGRYSAQFRQSLSSFLGIKHCILTTSGSSANLLAISALTSRKLQESRRIKPRDEVITLSAGFPTTVAPIIQNNAVPVFVDINLKTYNIDTSQLDDALSERTKAVFLAHTLGNPFNISKVKKFCEEHDLWLIEDNCDALGSKYEDKYTGTFGDLATCSFYPPHHITMGEGGAVLTNDPLLSKIVNSFREWGRDCWCPPGRDNTCNKRFEWQLGTLPFGYDHKYTYSEFGYNLKITDMQASIGVAQLEKLPKFIEARIRNHKRLFKGLSDYEDSIILPLTEDNSVPSWFGFLITLRDNFRKPRLEIITELEKMNIQTRLLFAGNLIRHPAFDEMRDSKSGYRVVNQLINTDKVMNDSFWVGVYPGMTDEKIDYMIKSISEVLTN